ncbi:AraC family transcriptional regulator [Paenibacillus sp. IB182496]|uniref:AraC family transcriptional regulator n=1 Tax=Paenibacillus sabuli TaxID=2772509 RepID=A0A927GS37_9BACL|nr:AraC family transcriptional regulator [Paenibacillus sabuli]MBD2845312.1 AraC family transcriptional regulator [Paenibacillus sabuli]
MGKQANKKRSIAQRLLLLGLLFSIVPVVIVSTIMYTVVAQRMTTEIERTNLNTMNQMRERIEGTLSQVDRMIVQGIYSYRLNVEIYEAGRFNWNAIEEMTMMLAALEELIEHADEVSVYIPESKRQVTAEGLFEDQGNLMDAYLDQGSWTAEAPYMWYERVAEPTARRAGRVLAGLTLIRKIPIAAEAPYGYFIVHLNEQVFADVFDQMKLGRTGGMLLLTPAGNRYAEPVLEQVLMGHEADGAIAQALSETTSTGGTMVRGPGGARHLLQTLESPLNGWTYAAIVPYDEITEPLQTMFKILWATCALIVGIAGFFLFRLYLRAAGRLNVLLGRMKYKVQPAEPGHRPADELGQIEHYMDRMHGAHEALASDYRQSVPDLKAHYVRQWLTEPFSESLRQNLTRHGLYEPDRLYAALCIEWGNEPAAAIAPVSLKMEDVVLTLEAAEVSSARCFLVRLDEDRIGGILEIAQGGADGDVKPWARSRLQVFVEAAVQQLKQAIVIGCSGTTGEAAELQHHFRQAAEALRHRLVDGEDKILFADELVHDPRAFRYPVQEEQSLLSAMHLGEWDEADLALERFAETLNRENALSAKQLVHAYALLLSALLRIGSAFGSGLAVEQRVLRADSFERLARLRTIEQIHQWLKEDVIKQLAAQTHAHRASASDEDAERIQQAIAYIHDHSDQDLSMKLIAEQVGLREAQFSLLFKRQSGLTYTDYVIAHRIERAKALLVQTDLKIAEIAGRMSYGNAQNFIRLFKQRVGMTPGEYRKRHR